MPALPKPYTADLGSAPISGGRAAGAFDFSGGSSDQMVAAGHQVSNTASFLQERMTQDEERQALVATTAIRAQYARKLDEATLSGADTTQLKQQMLDELGKVGQNFQTKQGADKLAQYTSNSEIMFDQQANQINVARAWSKAKLDGASIVKNASAIIQSNPTYLPVAEQNVDDYLKTFPGIRPEQRAELADALKKDLNMASAVAAARMNPADAKARLEAGEWNLDERQRNVAIDKAEAEIRAKRAEESYARAEQERQKHDADQKARDNNFAAIMNGTATRRSIMDDANLLPATREHLILLMEARSKEKAEAPIRTNPATFNSLREAIDKPPGTDGALRNPADIWKAYAARTLSKADAEDLEKRMRDNRSESGQKWAQAEAEFLRNARGQLDKSTLLNIDQEGGARMQAFTQYLRDKVTEYKNANPPKDPYTLLNPNAPDYIGKAIPVFQTGAQRMASDTARTVNDALNKGKQRPTLDDILGPKK